MSNSQWDPLRELEELLVRYGRGGAAQANAPARSEHLAAADWRPLVDIVETEDLYVIEAEIPGVGREDVRVGVEDGVLTIQGHRDAREGDAARQRRHRSERPHGRFARSFALPEFADPDRITARIEDGVLHVAIAKRAAAGRRGIEIKVD